MVLGGINTDYLIKGDRFPNPGETLKGDEFRVAPGGKGANQAVAATRLGIRAALIGCVGTDERGNELIRNLEGENVGTDCLNRTGEQPSGAALVMVDSTGEKSILAFTGANRCITVEQVGSAGKLISSAKVLLMSFESPMEVLIKAAQIAHEAGVKVVLDPAPPENLPDELIRLLYAVRPNSHEAEVLTGIKVRDRDTAFEAARQLQGRGPRLISTQAGSDGNVMLWGEQEEWVPKVELETVDSTGAGDAFIAALSVAIIENQSPAEALRFCSAAAALTTTRLGAQSGIPHRAEVDALMRKSARETKVTEPAAVS